MASCVLANNCADLKHFRLQHAPCLLGSSRSCLLDVCCRVGCLFVIELSRQVRVADR